MIGHDLSPVIIPNTKKSGLIETFSLPNRLLLSGNLLHIFFLHFLNGADFIGYALILFGRLNFD